MGSIYYLPLQGAIKIIGYSILSRAPVSLLYLMRMGDMLFFDLVLEHSWQGSIQIDCVSDSYTSYPFQ
jgi:hypothetical protein